ncbi:MAG: hypothetical protein U5L04_06810 [Trueperaceae bacterium]|nr:hypothetical protein [Trueperaceae bacterium]
MRTRRFAPLPSLIGLLIFSLGAYSALRVHNPAPTPPRTITFTESALPATSQRDVALTVVNEEGLPSSFYVSLDTPDPLPLRLEAVLAELRRRMIDENVWPERLPTPTVFVTDLAGEAPVAVLDVTLTDPVAASVAQERHILTALRQTLQRNGVSDVYILINGEPRDTFLGHVALDTSLD